MALIGKIRERSWLLVVVVGIAMLAFIIGDFNFGGGGPQQDTVGIGTIDGEMVDEAKYNNFLNNARNNIFQNKQMQNPNEPLEFTKQDENNAQTQAWRTILNEVLMSKEYKSIGLVVDEFEIDNVLYGDNGYEPSSFSTQFTDSITGEFAPEQLRMALDQLMDSGDPQDVMQYNNIIDYIRQLRLEQKYATLVSAGIHTTALEAKNEYYATKTVKNVTYVYQPFNSVTVEQVGEPTENEVEDYYAKHKGDAKFKQDASRRIAYFTIPVMPSHEDTVNAMEYLNKLIPNFAKSNRDSSFVLRYSDVKRYANDSTSIARPEHSAQPMGYTYPASIAKEMESAKKGDIVGPYSDFEGAKISKVIGFSGEKTATVRHILLSANTPDDMKVAQTKADSIIRVIRANNNFEEMVTTFSEDPGSVENGGKYENFLPGVMVQPFNDFSFQKPIGTLGSVETSFGIHIIEVLGREETQRPIIANIVKRVEASKVTTDNVNGLASNYIFTLDEAFQKASADEYATIFDTLAKNNGYSLRFESIKDENPVISAGFSDVAEGRFLRLAYQDGAKIGDLSSSPIRDRNQIIVAYVADISDGKTPSYRQVRDMMYAEVLKEKQADYISDMMLNSRDLESLSNELGAQLHSEGLTFSARNVAAGSEPQIIGVAFSGLADGDVSIPVKGNNGVFVLRVDETTHAEATEDFSAERGQLQNQSVSSFLNQFQNALIDGAEVNDNRSLRKYGVR